MVVFLIDASFDFILHSVPQKKLCVDSSVLLIFLLIFQTLAWNTVFYLVTESDSHIVFFAIFVPHNALALNCYSYFLTLGGVDSSFVLLQCSLWYSQCLLSQKSFHHDIKRRRKRRWALMTFQVMMMSWKRKPTAKDKWIVQFLLLWDLERMLKVKHIYFFKGAHVQ